MLLISVSFFLINLFIYLSLAVLGLRFCARAFSSCGQRGPLFIAVHGPLTIMASLVAEHRLQTRRLSNCGSRAQVLQRHVGSSQTRARTRVPRIGRQILNHCATREAQSVFLYSTSIPWILILRWSSLRCWSNKQVGVLPRLVLQLIPNPKRKLKM